MAQTTFSDLPLDILICILPHLAPVDFLALCATCKAFSEPTIRHEPSYWHHATKTKFRVPNRPAAQADGHRWEKLYKRLHSQSRVYTWGSNTHGCLGRGIDTPSVPRRGIRPMIPPVARRFGGRAASERHAWPEEVERAKDVGVIADLQCGGWSTSILNDKGVIYSVGVMNGMNQWDSQVDFTALQFPEGYPEREEGYNAKTAISHFSSGRTHVLGLSDAGAIWSWFSITRPAREIKLSSLEDASVVKVAAGWNKSSALLRGHGIVLWAIQDHYENIGDSLLLADWTLIPRTGYKRPRAQERSEEDDLADTVGEVSSYVVLEHWVVFTTDLRKTFAYRINHDTNSGVVHDIFELPELSAASDVQGSFRTFAVFKGDGEVVIADQDSYLHACFQRAFEQPGLEVPDLRVIPALQHSGVVQVAFGDYHYHALHADGSVSSYGVEPSECGAFGLGGSMDMDLPHGMLRGIKSDPHNRDGKLLPHGYLRGRRVWFQREKEHWIRFLAAGGRDKEEATERMRMVGVSPAVQGEVSEWVEQMGSNWDSRPSVREVDEDGLGAHFALSVAAAGWHSGALVLVNEDVVKAVRESCLVDDPDYAPSPVAESSRAAEQLTEGILNLLADVGRVFLGLPTAGPAQDPNQAIDSSASAENEGEATPKGKRWAWSDQSFPRLKLAGGREMPGTVPFSDWRGEKPSWNLTWTGGPETVFGISGWTTE